MDLRLGVVTVWYGGAHNIARFALNKKRIVRPDFLHVHVINYLEETAEKRLRSSFPQAIFINVGKNIGTAAAWNRAFEMLHQMSVNTLSIWDPDVELADDCFTKLAATLYSKEEIGCVGPLILFSHDREVVQFYGGSLNTRTGIARHDYRGTRDITSLPPSRNAEYLEGGTMMLRMEAIRRAGMFDERLFIYREDADLCIRLRNVGYRTVAVRDALAWHYHVEQNKDGAPYDVFYNTRNMFYLAKKYGTKFGWISFLFRSFWIIPKRSASYIYHMAFHLLIPLWAGTFCGMLGIMGKRGWVK